LLAALLILGAAALHLAYLAWFCPLDLAPDEAHYWDWSRHLDWSYYSKGPLVAYLIRAGCALLGDWSVEQTGTLMLAVRCPAVACGSLLLLSLYVLTLQVFGRPGLALAAIAAALTVPVLAAGSSLMTIDAPYACCWGWALVFAYRATCKGSGWAWEATGLAVGVGILAKYTMVLFLPSLALFLLTDHQRRKLLWGAGFWSMIGVAVLCCLPILVWNAQHDWATFRHVQRLAGLAALIPAEAGAPGFTIHWTGPLVFLGGQCALLLVFWFLAWLAAMVAQWPRPQRDVGTRFLWWLSAPMFLLFLGFSLKTGGGELNWPITAYLSGLVLAAAWLGRQFTSGTGWYRRLVAVNLTLVCLVGLGLTVLVHRSDWAHPVLAVFAGPPTEKQPYPLRRFDPTCRLRGWRQTLATQIDEVREELRQQGIEPVVACTGWSMPGELGFYCDGHPTVYSVGLALGDRHSQYDLWPGPVTDPEAFLGKTFIVVGTGPQALAPAFDAVEGPRWVTHHENGRPVAGWSVVVGRGFKGFPARRGPIPN
jgi:4-amino-4-deoxy-L-arabinose transferase-like glycosyltransferase